MRLDARQHVSSSWPICNVSLPGVRLNLPKRVSIRLRPPRSCRSKDQTARQGAGYPRHLLIAQAEPNVGSVTSKRLAGLAAGATWPRNLFGAGLLRSIRDRPCWTSARSCLSVEKRSGLNLDTPNQVIGQRAPGGVGNVRRIDHSPFY